MNRETIGERIKAVRVAAKLTQARFGARIGIKQPSLAAIEHGDNNPSDQTVYAICREFRVNEEWLREGKGEPFSNDKDSILGELIDKHRLGPEAQAMLSTYITMDEDVQKAVFAYMCAVVDQMRAGAISLPEPSIEERERAELERQIEKEKNGAGEGQEHDAL